MNTDDLILETAAQKCERLSTPQKTPVPVESHQSITQPVLYTGGLTIETTEQTSERLAKLASPLSVAISEDAKKTIVGDEDDILIPESQVPSIPPVSQDPASTGKS